MGVLGLRPMGESNRRKADWRGIDLEKLAGMDNAEWQKLYQTFKEPFALALIHDFGLQEEGRVRRLFGEAMFCLLKQIRRGKQPADLLSYCIGIGKNLCRSEYRRGSRLTSLDILTEVSPAEAPHWERLQKSETKEKLRQALMALGQPCHTILSAFYFQRIKLKDLADRMEELVGRTYTYASLRVKKARCMDALKKHIKTFDRI